MATIVIYGYKGKIIAKPFQVNTVDDEPEAMTEEENQIFNYTASDTDNQEESKVGENSGN